MAGVKLPWWVAIRGFKPIGSHVDGTVLTSAVTLTPPSGATKLLIQVLDQDVRYTLDGTTPTASLGFQLKKDDPPLIIIIEEGVVIKMIQEAATADIQYQWGS
jgi:hypothetical protein